MLIAGVDEVGRGAFAGPVVAAAVILGEEKAWHSQIKDSKKLSSKKRQELSEAIWAESIACSIAQAEHYEIDEMNILQATLKAMKDAVLSLKVKPELILIDGDHIIPGLDDYEQQAVVDGDDTIKSISAASIIAKVYRDNLMVELDKVYPEYNFQRNKGYGTRQHRDAIGVFGLCEIHRRSFIKER